MAKRLYYPRRSWQVGRKLQMPNQYQIHDITRPLTSSLPVWPGSIKFELNTLKTFPNMGMWKASCASNIHTGTHADAASPFRREWPRCLDICTQRDDWSSESLRIPWQWPIDIEFLEAQKIQRSESRLILKTKNSSQLFKDGKSFDPSFVAITSAAAKWLVDKGIRLIGIDGPSIQRFSDETNDTHAILLGARAVVLEGLQLGSVHSGSYFLIALPLKIPNAEGAPVRAILMDGEL